MSFLYHHQWLLFFASEGLTWILAVLFLASRYFFSLNRFSLWCLVFVILGNAFQFFLASIDYYFAGKVSFFQIVIILFVIYASTLGSSDFQRLDKYIKEKVMTWKKNRGHVRGSITQIFHVEEKEDIRAPRKYKKQLFFIHITTFIVIHFLWFIIDINESNDIAVNHLFLFIEWIEYPHRGFFNNPFFNIMSYVWSIIFFFDLVVFLTSTFLDKLRKR